MGPWFASGRYKEGWFLGGKKTADPEDDWGTAVRRIETVQPSPPPLQIRVVSTAYAKYVASPGVPLLANLTNISWRWFYNKTMLPRIPLLGLTVGQLLVRLGRTIHPTPSLMTGAGNRGVSSSNHYISPCAEPQGHA